MSARKGNHSTTAKMSQRDIESIVCSAENLYEASKKVIASNPGKPGTVIFKQKRLAEIRKAQMELRTRKWTITQLDPFTIHERGHRRKIVGNSAYDRMIIHSYLDFGLEPLLRRYLIFDNYASQVGKGTDLARNRFKEFLNRAFREYGHNRFFVMLIDFAKFYDNVQHEKLKQAILAKVPPDPFHEYMLDTILNSMKTDVSHMSDEEYARRMETKYSALAHYDDLHNGTKYMAKGLNIGNQGSQLFSIFYPTRIDTYLRCVEGMKYHGRYMDDTFVILNDKDRLRAILGRVTEIAKEMGLFIHEHKTQIYRIDKGVKFLNRMYRMDTNGCVRERVVRSTITRELRKLKKFKAMLDDGSMTYGKIQNQFQSWMGNFKKAMTKKQREDMTNLYNTLFISKWKEER